MAATVVRRARILKPAAKAMPTAQKEPKFYNSKPEDIRHVLHELAKCDVRVVYVVVDKDDVHGKYHGIYGNSLYRSVLQEVISASMESADGNDVSILLDKNSFISLEDFRNLSADVASELGKNAEKVQKVDSEQNACIRIADYVAGSVRAYYEYGDDTFIKLIEGKVSIARRC